MISMEKELCGAKTRGGTPCRKAALKNGRCKLHGGKSTGPKDVTKLKGNKNALKHGAHEYVWYDTLTEEEKGLIKGIETDPDKRLENRFLFTEVRIRRMMKRIQEEQAKEKPSINRIQKIEEEITKIQAQEVNLIREGNRRSELQGVGENNVNSLDQFVSILARARQKYDGEPQGN